MFIHSTLRYAYDETLRSYGEHSAWARCHEYFQKAVNDDRADAKDLLESAPEPSDIERSMWPPATINYVEILEEIVDGILDRHGILDRLKCEIKYDKENQAAFFAKNRKA